MATIFTVFLKEVLENFRDRRTLVSALIMGPIFGPVLFSFVINLSIERSIEDAEKTMELPIIGQEHAPDREAAPGHRSEFTFDVRLRFQPKGLLGLRVHLAERAAVPGAVPGHT